MIKPKLKPKLKHIFILVTITLLLFLQTNSVLAQTGEIEISKLETQIMPEYDTPDILIVNSIQLKNISTKAYTGDLKWRIPKGAIKHIVSDQQVDKHIQFNILPGKDYDEMAWKMPVPIKAGEVKTIHLEYYYNNIQGNPDKMFSFELEQNYPIYSAQLVMLQPTKATNFKITPDFGQPQSNQGFTYYIKNVNNLAVNQKLLVSVTYTKSDPNPSILPGQQQVQNQNQGVQGTGNKSDSKLMIFLLAGVAILIVIIITLKITSSNKNDNQYDDDYYDDEEYLQKPKKKGIVSKGVSINSNEKVIDHKKNHSSTNISPEKLSKLKWLELEKKKLHKKLEAGLITDVDYYEGIIELEEEARDKFGL